MQTFGRLPRAIAHPRNRFAMRTGRMEWDATTIAGQQITIAGHPDDLCLHAFDRRIDKASSAAGTRFLAENVPRLSRLPDFEFHPHVIDAAENRIAKLEMRS